MNRPEPGQWWLQTDKQDRSDAKFFRVFFCGRNSLGRLIFEDADGHTEVDHGCDWSKWRHEPACTGWDWVPEVKAAQEYPKWYVPRNPNEVCEPFGKPIAYYRRDSKKKGETFYTDGESFKWGYWEGDLNSETIPCSQADAEARVTKRPLPCSYCSKLEFKGWVLGKCPYCGKVKETVVKSPAEDPGDGYRFVSSDEVVLETDERAYVYEDSEAIGLIWGEVDKAVWFESGKTAGDLRRKLRARNVVFRRKATDPAKVATVTVYQIVYGDDLNQMLHRFVTAEHAVEHLKHNWKYVSVVSTKNVEVML